MRSLTTLVALVLSATALVRSQDPARGTGEPRGTDPVQDEGAVARDLFGRPAPDQGSVYEELQGAWQLVAIDDPELPVDGRSLHGMLLVSGQFLAIEIHVAWDDAEGNAIEDAFQTGFHEFAMDRYGTIQMLSLIGSFLDEEEELDWEAPGTVREFRAVTDGAFLTLSRPDGSSLKFVRRRPRVGQSRDIFGRTSDGSAIEGRDMFGRTVAPQLPPELPPAGDDGDEDGR